MAIRDYDKRHRAFSTREKAEAWAEKQPELGERASSVEPFMGAKEYMVDWTGKGGKITHPKRIYADSAGAARKLMESYPMVLEVTSVREVKSIGKNMATLSNRFPVYDKEWKVVGYTTKNGYKKASEMLGGASVKWAYGSEGGGWIDVTAPYRSYDLRTGERLKGANSANRTIEDFLIEHAGQGVMVPVGILRDLAEKEKFSDFGLHLQELFDRLPKDSRMAGPYLAYFELDADGGIASVEVRKEEEVVVQEDISQSDASKMGKFVYETAYAMLNKAVQRYGPNAKNIMRKAQMVRHDPDNRIITYVMTTEDEDRDGETVNPAGGNFDEYMQNKVVLWNHDSGDFPLGKLIDKPWNDYVGKGTEYPEVEGERRLALLGKVFFSNENPKADQAYRQATEPVPDGTTGTLSGSSISFLPDGEVSKNGKGGNHYDKWRLLEFTLCSVGSNPSALKLGKMVGESKDDLAGPFSSEDEAITAAQSFNRQLEEMLC